MNYEKIKPEIIASIRRYADEYCPTGSFLEAVLNNDLTEAVGRADEDNLKALPEIVGYCYNEIPMACWGSPEKVEKWLARRFEGAP